MNERPPRTARVAAAVSLLLLPALQCRDAEPDNPYDPQAEEQQEGGISVRVDLEDMPASSPWARDIRGTLLESATQRRVAPDEAPPALTEDGLLVFDALEPGAYDVCVEDDAGIFAEGCVRHIEVGIGERKDRELRLVRTRFTLRCDVLRLGGQSAEGLAYLWVLRIPPADPGPRDASPRPHGDCGRALDQVVELRRRQEDAPAPGDPVAGGPEEEAEPDTDEYRRYADQLSTGTFEFPDLREDPYYCLVAAAEGHVARVFVRDLGEPAECDLELHPPTDQPDVLVDSFRQVRRCQESADECDVLADDPATPTATDRRLILLRLRSPDGTEDGDGGSAGEDPIQALRVLDRAVGDTARTFRASDRFYCLEGERPPDCAAWGQQFHGADGADPDQPLHRVLTPKGIAGPGLARFCPPRPRAGESADEPFEPRWQAGELAVVKAATTGSAPATWYAYCLSSFGDGPKELLVQFRRRTRTMSAIVPLRALLDQEPPARLTVGPVAPDPPAGGGPNRSSDLYASQPSFELQVGAWDRWTATEGLRIRLCPSRRPGGGAGGEGGDDAGIRNAGGDADGGGDDGPADVCATDPLGDDYVSMPDHGRVVVSLFEEEDDLQARQGEYGLVFVAADEAGNTASRSVRTVFDGVAPDVGELLVVPDLWCPALPQVEGCTPGEPDRLSEDDCRCDPDRYLAAYDGNPSIRVVGGALLTLRFVRQAEQRGELDAYAYALSTSLDRLGNSFVRLDPDRPIEWEMGPDIDDRRPTPIYWIVRDRAGNETTGTLAVFVDEDAPPLTQGSTSFLTEADANTCRNERFDYECSWADTQSVIGGKLFTTGTPERVTVRVVSDQSRQIASERDYLCAQFRTGYLGADEQAASWVDATPLLGYQFAAYRHPPVAPREDHEDERGVVMRLVDRACNVSQAVDLQVRYDRRPPQGQARVRARGERPDGVVYEVPPAEIDPRLVDCGRDHRCYRMDTSLSYDVVVHVTSEAESRASVALFLEVDAGAGAEEPSPPDARLFGAASGDNECELCPPVPADGECDCLTYRDDERTCSLPNVDMHGYSTRDGCPAQGDCYQPLRVKLRDLVGRTAAFHIEYVNGVRVSELLVQAPPAP